MQKIVDQGRAVKHKILTGNICLSMYVLMPKQAKWSQ